ncbi:Protein CBG16028 [Caenorhabditis briggsae]|uniref:Protein CBG16028 n=1 Tax=Caenorhabditis briggsae TaxID=6238 RepID=A8XN94_CAEBR|nr:Protein CBG16028 [Caenorhabditis briggsae]CAP34325.1 Protein CBG16028 [Caenorhabditis briggsae]
MTENREEKKFVIKYVFGNVPLYDKEVVYGNEEKHFGIFWKLRHSWEDSDYETSDYYQLEFRKAEDVVGSEWSMEIEVDSMLNVNLEAEFHVTIKKMTGFEIPKQLPKLRIFDDDVAKKFSDVCLLAGNQKFYVSKLFVASHSVYFESLFLGNFSEFQKSEIELKDVDPNDFQNFLELINGETFVNDDTVEGLLHLADFFDSKAVFRRCEAFMMNKSEKSLKSKFELAIKYRLEPLKKKCISGMKNKEDVKSVLPEDPFQINQDVWAELFNKAFSFN